MRIKPSNVQTDAERLTSRHFLSEGLGDPATADLPFAIDDWRIVQDTLTNALLIGPRTAVNAVIEQLLPLLRPPLWTWEPDVVREPPLLDVGTLIIREVDALDSFQQRHLLESLSSPNRDIRVISLASSPVYPLVQSGDFLEALYYRLNVVCVDLEWFGCRAST